MSDGTLRNLHFTPLRDLVRGRITGRVDLERIYLESELPKTATDIISQIVKRTRLWKLEKVDVAQELISHFHDGLQSGRSIEELLGDFGDAKQTARLIRRAKIRQRTLVWHCWRWMTWCVWLLAGLYVAMAAYYVSGSPELKNDYVAMLNVLAQSAPASDRAWPVYRAALLAIHSDEAVFDAFWRIARTEQWNGTVSPEVRGFLESHQDSISQIQQAAMMPRLGFVATTSSDPADAPLFWPKGDAPAQSTEKPGMVLSVFLPHLNELRTANQLLSLDTCRAAEAGDAQTVEANLIALLHMSGQLCEHGLFVTELTAIAFRAAPMELISQIVTLYPDLLSARQLQTLAHEIGAVQGFEFDVSGERLMFYDILQRVYTDDGNGDGRMTDEGVRMLSQVGLAMGELGIRGLDERGSAAFVPLAATAMASRKELKRTYDSLMDSLEADLSTDLIQRPQTVSEQRFESLREESFLRFFPLDLVFPHIANLRVTKARLEGQTEGALIGLALELWRRDNGTYPDSLAQLTPTMLPALPRDRITGAALHYRITEGHPVVYSVGADRDDDGGIVPRTFDHIVNINGIAEWNSTAQVKDGDWVLWPSHDVGWTRPMEQTPASP